MIVSLLLSINLEYLISVFLTYGKREKILKVVSIAAKVGDKGQEVAKACPIENLCGIIV